MQEYTKQIEIRWADIDANRHLRHSVYYDYAAAMRMNFLIDNGLTTEKLEEFKMGPILFREEAIFRREIRLGDKVMLDVKLLKATQDYSRWSLQHHFLKEGDIVCCVVTIDGAWIDLEKRKLAAPNELIHQVFERFPKAETFEWVIKEKKI